MISTLEWKLALRNLFRNKRRTMSTAMALVVAYVGISLLAGHVIKTERAMRAMLIYLHHLGHVSVYKTGGIDNFEAHPDRYIVSAEEIKNIRELLAPWQAQIEMVSESLAAPALISSGLRSLPVMVKGIPPELDQFVKEHASVRKWAPELRNDFDGQSYQKIIAETPDAISISKGVGELMGRFKPLSEISADDKEVVLAARNLDGDLNAVNATISFKHTTGMPVLEDTSVIAPLTVVRSLLQTNGAEHVVIFLKDMSDIDPVVEGLQKKFKERGLPLEALSFRDDRIGRFYNGTLSFLGVMVGFFSILILGASALIMVNSITMGVLERSKEMGTLRSLGFTPERVRSLFIKEAFWLAIFSMIAGVVLSQIGVIVVNSMKLTYVAVGISQPINVFLVLEPWYHVGMSTLMTAISMFSSYWVVTRKTKEKISVLLLDSGASL